MVLTLPKDIPEPGFYYHYKHDPKKGVTHYAYEVLGLGLHTEFNEFQVEYRPLYKEALVYQLGKLHDHRPLEMFVENVDINGQSVPRFSRVTDRDVIRALAGARNYMYPKTT